MATLTGIRNKLDVKVFQKIGTTALVSSVVTTSIDKWGDDTTVYSAGTTSSCVPYNYITDRLNYQPFGDLSEDDVVFVFRYDTVLDREYQITYDSKDYLVSEIELYPYQGEAIAYLVKASKKL